MIFLLLGFPAIIVGLSFLFFHVVCTYIQERRQTERSLASVHIWRGGRICLTVCYLFPVRYCVLCGVTGQTGCWCSHYTSARLRGWSSSSSEIVTMPSRSTGTRDRRVLLTIECTVVKMTMYVCVFAPFFFFFFFFQTKNDSNAT